MRCVISPMNLEVDGIGNTVVRLGTEVFGPGLDFEDSGVKGVRIREYFVSPHEQNPILLGLLPFSPECSILAFRTFTISRSITSCVTLHFAGSVSVLPA